MPTPMRQAPLRRTTTRRHPDHRPLASLLVVLVVVAVLVAFRSSGHSGNLPAAACAGDDCSQDAALPLATSVSTPTAILPTPCPYCGQDPARWTKLTGVPPPAISGTAATVIEGSCGRMLYGL